MVRGCRASSQISTRSPRGRFEKSREYVRRRWIAEAQEQLNKSRDGNTGRLWAEVIEAAIHISFVRGLIVVRIRLQTSRSPNVGSLIVHVLVHGRTRTVEVGSG
jgi:hypothetical protein